MNNAHLHLMLNHIPVLGQFGAVLLLAYAIWKKEKLLTVGSLVGVVLVGAAAVAANLSGEAAEELVEHLPGVAESLIEDHEEGATRALVASIGAGILALGGLILSRMTLGLPGWYPALVLLAALFSAGFLVDTANRGGKIRHTEIRAGAQTPVAESGTGGAERDGETEAEEVGHFGRE